MVCDLEEINYATDKEYVLILILLEYGLRQTVKGVLVNNYIVLILILLEYGLRLLKSQIIDFQTLKT